MATKNAKRTTKQVTREANPALAAKAAERKAAEIGASVRKNAIIGTAAVGGALVLAGGIAFGISKGLFRGLRG